MDGLERRGGRPAGVCASTSPQVVPDATGSVTGFWNGCPQVVHWDRQPPGVGHDRADRLVDLYPSGEQRNYGSQFLQRKMNISSRAFTDGDFSLTVSDLQVGDLETHMLW